MKILLLPNERESKRQRGDVGKGFDTVREGSGYKNLLWIEVGQVEEKRHQQK